MSGEKEMDNKAVAAYMPQLRKSAYRLSERGRRSETQMPRVRAGRGGKDRRQTARAVRFLCAAWQRYR